jgi:PII-like signaling protein
MHGYQLTFFTQQDRKHHGLSLAQWLLEEARNIGISGATLITAAEGFGHDRKIRSTHFFELADQPIEITMAVNAADAERLFNRLQEEEINIFYVKAPIEFGMTGDLFSTDGE